MAIGMYNRPMTEEEKRLMMIQGLRQNNMMMADSSSAVRASDFNSLDPSSAVRVSEYPADYTTGPTPGADMSQYNVIDPSSVVRESEMLNQGMNLDPNSVVRQPETISPMGTPMTPEQIDEEIMRLQILKNQMMMDN